MSFFVRARKMHPLSIFLIIHGLFKSVIACIIVIQSATVFIFSFTTYFTYLIAHFCLFLSLYQCFLEFVYGCSYVHNSFNAASASSLVRKTVLPKSKNLKYSFV